MMTSPAHVFSGLPDDIPALTELMSRRQWVAWRYSERDGNLTKPPINVHNGFGASHSDPATWATYEQACHYALQNDLPGVGYVITDDDEYTGADLDDCRDPKTGEIDDWAADIIALGETYTEVSPSGAGLRLIWRGKVEKTIKCDPASVEVYRNKRYLTITGDHVKGTPRTINAAPQTALALLERSETFRAQVATTQPALSISERAMPARGKISAALMQASPRSNFFREANTRALQNLAAWVPALFGGWAVFQTGTGAYRVSSKSLGRNLQEDLSIAPNGIVDFGVADMGDPQLGKRTPIDLVIEFGRHKTAVDAAHWLCERIGVTPSALGWVESASIAPGNPVEGPQIDPNTGEILEITQSAKEFINAFTPPEYLIDGVMQRGYLYSLTARTGHGKTAVSMYLAQSIARGLAVHGREVLQGTVLYLAGENPDDIRARFITMADHCGYDATSINMRFVGGVIDIKASLATIRAEAIKDLVLVIVDTAAAYFKGDDANSNAQQGDYARLLRQLTFLPGKPAVLVPSHPVKNASPDNLIPMGGSSFLNEVDGNLTLWAGAERQTTLHWQGKFRGPEFEPMSFEIETITSDRVKDAKGRLMPSVLARPIGEMQIEMAQKQTEMKEEAVLGAIYRSPRGSIATWASMAGFLSKDGKPQKSTVLRICQRLAEEKFLIKSRGRFKITKKGKQEIGAENDDD